MNNMSDISIIRKLSNASLLILKAVDMLRDDDGNSVQGIRANLIAQSELLLEILEGSYEHE